MNKILNKILILLTFISLANSCIAAPIVELAAPRGDGPKIITDEEKKAADAKKAAIVKKQSMERARVVAQKKKKKIVPKKPKPIVVNYDNVSKMIEYGNFVEADKILSGALQRNSKDTKAQALWAVSFAKQNKLDFVQSQLDKLLKQYPNNSDLHYAQGMVYYNRTKSSDMAYINTTQDLLNRALSEFKKSVALDKNNAKAYNAMGVVALQLGDESLSKDSFKKALIADKTYATAIDNLGTFDYNNGNFIEAENKFKQALVFNPYSSTAMYHMAQVNIQKQDYSKALTYLNTALSINPNNAAIFNLMGEIYNAQGNEAAAINSFKKSIAIKPEFTRSYLDLSNIYEKRGDSELALDQLKTALSVNPTYYDAKLKIADISFDAGKFKEAAKVYAELVGVEGYDSAAVKGLANSYYGLAQVSSSKSLISSSKDLYNALEYVNKAIATNKNDLELHLAKLKLTKITNQPDQAKVVLEQIIDSPDNSLMSNVVKGEAYLTLNNYSQAQDAFNNAIKLSQTELDDLYLSEIFIYHRQYNCAEDVISRVLKTNPQNQQALNDMDYIQKCKKNADNCYKSAQYYLKKNNYIAASEYLAKSIAINPNNSDAHLLLAQLYEKQCNNRDAVTNYRAYLGLVPNAKDANKINKKINKLENDL